MLHLPDIFISHLQTSSGRDLDIDDKLPGIGAREERYAKEWKQREAQHYEGSKTAYDQYGSIQTNRDSFFVGLLQPLELLIETVDDASKDVRALFSLFPFDFLYRLLGTAEGAIRSDAVFRLQTDELRAEQRHDSHGDGIRSKERQHDREGQSAKDIFADTREQDDRKEHDACAACSCQHGELDFFASVDGSFNRRFAQLHMTKDVLKNNDRVINQAGERERDAAKHHGVDGARAQVQRNEGGKTRNGDRE